MGGAGKAVTSVDFSWSVLSDRKQVQALEFLLPVSCPARSLIASPQVSEGNEHRLVSHDRLLADNIIGWAFQKQSVFK